MGCKKIAIIIAVCAIFAFSIYKGSQLPNAVYDPPVVHIASAENVESEGIKFKIDVVKNGGHYIDELGIAYASPDDGEMSYMVIQYGIGADKPACTATLPYKDLLNGKKYKFHAYVKTDGKEDVLLVDSVSVRVRFACVEILESKVEIDGSDAWLSCSVSVIGDAGLDRIYVNVKTDKMKFGENYILWDKQKNGTLKNDATEVSNNCVLPAGCRIAGFEFVALTSDGAEVSETRVMSEGHEIQSTIWTHIQLNWPIQAAVGSIVTIVAARWGISKKQNSGTLSESS